MTTEIAATAPYEPTRLHSSAFFAGFSGLAYQIISYKLILAAGLGDGLSIALSLTAFVTLSGCGSVAVKWAGSRLLSSIEPLLGLYGLVLFGIVLSSGLVAYIEMLDQFSLLSKLSVVLALQAPMAFLSGALIPVYDRRTKSTDTNNSSFPFIYAGFHFGGATGLLLMENYLFPGIGFLKAGLLFSSLTLVNGLLPSRRYMPNSNGHNSDSTAHRTAFVLLGISIATGILGIAIYKAFDYIVGPNIRNYTTVTAGIFVGLGLSGWLSTRKHLNLKVMATLSGTGILLFCLLILLIPSSLLNVISLGLPAGIGYLLSAMILGLPVYALVGLSVPVSVQSGLSAGTALFICAIGNCIGYWFYIATTHIGYDLAWLAITGTVLIFASGIARPFIASLLLMSGLWLSGIQVTPSVHQSILGERLLTEAAIKDRLLDRHTDRDFVIEKSWSSWGSPVEHAALYETNDEDEHQKEYLVINGFKSLSLENLKALQYAESAAAMIPAMFTPKTDNALVIGAGTGVSAGSVTALFNHVDLVDINPDTPSMLEYFAPVNWDVADRATLTQQDAFSYLSNSEQYDYIFGTATGAGYAFSALLYSREFFDRVNTSLKQDGVYAMWLDSRSPRSSTASEIVSALKTTFSHVKWYTVYPNQIVSNDNLPYTVFLASQSPLTIQNHAESVLSFLNRLSSPYIKQSGSSIDRFLQDRILKGPFTATVTPATMDTLAYAYTYQYELKIFGAAVSRLKRQIKSTR